MSGDGESGTGARGARRLVLNGLTAEVRGAPAAGGGSPDSLDCYHELELYRQLLALPAAPASPPAAGRRALTPEPAQSHESPPPARRSRTPGPAPSARAVRRASPAPAPPAPLARPARYLGSFPVAECAAGAGAAGAAGPDSRAHLAAQLHLIKENGRAVPVLVVVALSGVKVCDPEDQSVRMSYALRRILYATCESVRALFAVVAREPRSKPARTYCHAFETDTPEQAEELNTLLGDAFRMAFASQRHPSAPLWSTEVSGAECGSMGVRAPDSLPGIPTHYPHPHCGNRSPAKCDLLGMSRLVNEPSPSSSEESNSPTEVSCYRRLGERPPLMKRLAMGLSGALLQPSDDDSTPLVADTPTTPTNLPLCMNGGYINEASEAEARTRESNRDHPPVPLPPTPRRNDNMLGETDDFRRCTNLKNSPPGACSRTTSSSSGASSCGGGVSHGSGNNNVPRAEPELRGAPWFQQGIPREIALEVLGSQPVGAFLVRGSTTQAGCYALSVRVPRDFQPAGIAHYLILRTHKGYKIKGFTKEFTSLSALVTHHSVMPELLPVPLHLPWAAHGARAPRREHADIDAVAPHSATHSARHAPRPHVASFLAQLDV